MSPELEQAVKERIDLGHSQEQIADELRAAGYDDQTIEHIYHQLVPHASAIPPAPESGYATPQGTPGGALIGFKALIKMGFAVAASQWKVFVLTFVYVVATFILFAIAFGLLLGILMTVPGGEIISVLAGVVFFVLYFAVNVVLIGAMLRAILLRNDGERLGRHIGWMRQRMWSGLGVTMLQQFMIYNAFYILFAFIAVVLAIGFTLFSNDGAMDLHTIESMMTSSRMLVFAILSIVAYLGTMIAVLLLAAYAGWAMLCFVSDRAKGVASVTESALLVQGRVWSVFSRLLFFGLLAFAVMFVSAFVLTIFGVPEAVMENLSSLVQFLFTPFLVSASVLLFESLRTTEQPVSQELRQKIHTRVQIGIWTGAAAMLLYVIAILVVVFMAVSVLTSGGQFDGLQSGGSRDIGIPSLNLPEPNEISPQEQAEMETFMEEFGAELGDGQVPATE